MLGILAAGASLFFLSTAPPSPDNTVTYIAPVSFGRINFTASVLTSSVSLSPSTIVLFIVSLAAFAIFVLTCFQRKRGQEPPLPPDTK